MATKTHKNLVVLGVALTIGLIAAFGAQRYFKARQDELNRPDAPVKTLRFIVAREDLPKGATLSKSKLAVRELPAEYAQSNALDPAQFERIAGSRTAFPVKRGELLMSSMLEDQNRMAFSARVSPGRRAISVPVDEINSMSGMLQPGDRIDLFVKLERERRTQVVPVLQDMLVLAAGNRVTAQTGTDGGVRSYSAVTLDASADEGRLMVLARDAGKLTAMLRHPDDRSALPIPPDLLVLLGGGAPPVRMAARAPAPGIPVLIGGRGALASPAMLPQPDPQARALERLSGALERLAAPVSAVAPSEAMAASPLPPAGPVR